MARSMLEAIHTERPFYPFIKTPVRSGFIQMLAEQGIDIN